MDTKLMFKYLRKLPGKWFLPIIALVWLLGVGMRWYTTKTCIILTLVIIALWLIYILLKWLQARTRGPEVDTDKIPGFEERLLAAIKMAKRSPWYLSIGPQKCGKTSLLMKSDLNFPYIDSLQEESLKQKIEGTKNCDIFFTKGQVIFDTTGRYVELGSENQARPEWFALLSLLKKHRKERPIEGLIVAVNVDRILRNEEDVIKKEANFIRNRVSDIMSRLGMMFPVYVIFTKCDLIYGFRPFFKGLGTDNRMQVWGATLRRDQQEEPEAAFKSECKKLLEALMERRMHELASVEKQDRSAVYVFPLEFDAACQKLAHFITALFPRTPDEKPTFRGFYFTSATQEEEAPIDFVIQRVARSFSLRPPSLSATSTDADQAKSYFIRDVFNDVIFPDKGLDKPTGAAEKRRMYVRLGFCVAAALLFAFLATMFTVSYFRSKRLMADAQTQAISVRGITSDTTLEEREERFDKLREPIVRLERASLFNLPWKGRRNDVADAARRLYLSDRYQSDDKWQHKLTRKIEVPVKVYIKSDAGQLEWLEDVNVKAVVNNKVLSMKTNKEGSATLKAKVEDGRVLVVFSIDRDVGGYEVEQEQIYTVQPGETVIGQPVRFAFSKTGRVVIVTCLDQDNKPLAGVPVSIIEQTEESKNHGPEISNEQGVSRFTLDAPEGTVAHIYYGDSPANYGTEEFDKVKMEPGESRYPVTRQLRRKIQIVAMAFIGAEGDPNRQMKAGVSIFVDRTKLGTTDANGQWTGSGDNVPTTQNLRVDPPAKNIKITETVSGIHEIELEYEPAAVAVTTPGDTIPKPPPEKYLQIVDDSGQAIPNLEAWLYVKAESAELFNKAKENDQMEFSSDGKQFRLVRLSGSFDRDGRLKLPKEVEGHQFLLCHPDYWPQKVGWNQIEQQVRMVSIRQTPPVKYDKAHKDGAMSYFNKGREGHMNRKWEEVIPSYQKAIRLEPTKLYYYHLVWAYNDSGQQEAARREFRRGNDLNLPESDVYVKELKNRLQNMLYPGN